MSDKHWQAAWEHWLAARFGEGLSGSHRANTIRDAELMRGYGDTLWRFPLGNGELPFSHLLPLPGGEEGE